MIAYLITYITLVIVTYYLNLDIKTIDIIQTSVLCAIFYELSEIRKNTNKNIEQHRT